MTQMDADMKKADQQMTGRPDADFIRLMIPHHQGAIDMAKAEVLHDTDWRLSPLSRRSTATASGSPPWTLLTRRPAAAW